MIRMIGLAQQLAARIEDAGAYHPCRYQQQPHAEALKVVPVPLMFFDKVYQIRHDVKRSVGGKAVKLVAIAGRNWHASRR